MSQIKDFSAGLNKDLVYCVMCDEKMIVNAEQDDCPLCGCKGCLMDVE